MPDNKDIHILVVDDEPNMRWILSKILEEQGYKVSAADNGEEAIEIVKKGHIDLIIMDVMLPGINGVEAFRQIKKMNVNLPVVMITGYGSANMTKEAMKLGAVDYITKPFKNEYLLDLIKEALSKKNKKKREG